MILFTVTERPSERASNGVDVELGSFEIYNFFAKSTRQSASVYGENFLRYLRNHKFHKFVSTKWSC